MARGRFPAKPVEIDGIRFASQREAKRYGELKLLEKAGVINQIEVHPAFPVEINGEPFCTYTADFRYRDKRRLKRVIEDVKSSGTRKDTAYRLRKKAAELFYYIEIEEVGA